MSDGDAGDRVEITQVLYRYGRWSVATRDVDAIVACFADDAELIYHGLPERRGIASVRSYFQESLDGATASAHMGLDVALVSTPIVTNALIDVDGDSAHAVSSCLAIHAGVRDSEGTVLVRGTENDDQLSRVSGEWKIQRRTHRVLWSFAVPGQVHLGE